MMNLSENEFPLENINEIIIDNGIVNIIYNDGNKHIVNSNKVRFIMMNLTLFELTMCLFPSL